VVVITEVILSTNFSRERVKILPDLVCISGALSMHQQGGKQLPQNSLAYNSSRKFALRNPGALKEMSLSGGSNVFACCIYI